MNVHLFYLEIINIDNIDQKIELCFNRGFYPYCCTFNSNIEIILYSDIYRNRIIKKLDHYIWIYYTKNNLMNSTPTDNNEWMYKRIYKIPGDYDLNELISENYDKLYLLSNHSIYEWK